MSVLKTHVIFAYEREDGAEVALTGWRANLLLAACVLTFAVASHLALSWLVPARAPLPYADADWALIENNTDGDCVYAQANEDSAKHSRMVFMSYQATILDASGHCPRHPASIVLVDGRAVSPPLALETR